MNYTLGYFLEERHIEGAYHLLKKQIEETKPLYNTLDFKIFRNDKVLENFNTTSFYNDFVKNDVFYYFQNKVFLLDYVGVQSAHKLRNYHFLSFEALVIYNAIGLYLNEVLELYQLSFNVILKESQASVYYGGKINKEAKKSNIFYYEDYQKFISKKEELTKPQEGKVKYVITMDIKSFFYSINHKILLDIINQNAISVSKKKIRFDENTIASIEFFFKYIMKGNCGIPVSSQNLVSSFLSSIYFAPFDHYVIDNYLKDNSISYIRYVDDFYLICEFDKNEKLSKIRNFIYSIENNISFFLMNELKISVSNDKMKRTKIDDLDSYYEFLSHSNAPSQGEGEIEIIQIKDILQEKSIEGKSLPDIFNECMEIIKKLKEKTLIFDKIDIDKKDSNFLNLILINKGVLDYSKSKDAITLIDKEKLFIDYNFLDYVLTKTKIFLHLISLTKENRDYFHNLILEDGNNINNINQRIMLAERFILQLDFLSEKDKKEEIILKSDITKYKEDYKKIINEFLKVQTNNTYAKLALKMIDFDVNIVDFEPIYGISILNKEISLMQQIKQRVINEKLGYFNVAFNHLLNEFQKLVEITYFEGNETNADSIWKKLSEKKFEVKEILKVYDFFKRRNQNSISHYNYSELGFWAVSETEYYEYKTDITRVIIKVLNEYNATP